MEGHRQRLIESGLLVPLSNEEIARRNGILQHIAERRAQGDKCKGVDIPEWNPMDGFDSRDLQKNVETFDRILAKYREEYQKAGMEPKIFPNVDAFLAQYE